MSEPLDLSSLGNIDFTPSWAKKDAGVTVSGGRGKPYDDARKPFGQGGSRPASDCGGRDARGGRPFGDKKPFGDRKPLGRPRFEERPRPLDAEIKILPETKSLGTIIRKLQGDSHAYKLKDLAYFFLDNPSSILLKVTPRKTPESSPSAPAFFQCRACGFASTKEEDVVEHAVAVHLGDYYDSKEVEVEPPKGNFNCVAKCGLSGVLLGPPNIHEFASVVREMVRTRYPDMSEQQYRSHIEMLRDAESIEQWRQGATKRTMFFAKGTADQEGARALTRTEAESEFRVSYLASLLDRPKHLMVTAEQAMKSPLKPLVWAAKDALEQERRAPYNICFALRGAFHHRKLKFFRVNDAHGQEFVTNVELKEFDAEHAIPELAAMAKFIAEHPCCDLKELPPGEDSVKHLQWLVSTGHVVAFTNGVYSIVEKYPKYGPQWKKRAKGEGQGEGDKAKGEGQGEGAKAKGEEAKAGVLEQDSNDESVDSAKEEVKDAASAQLAE